MRYLTDKWFRLLQADKSTPKAERFIDQQARAYGKSLVRLQGKLPSRLYRYLCNGHHYDALLLGLHLEEIGRFRWARSMDAELQGRRGRMVLSLCCPTDGPYDLVYDNVSRFEMKSSKGAVRATQGQLLSHDEFLLLASGRFQHEFYFHSGTTILVEFQKARYIARPSRPKSL